MNLHGLVNARYSVRKFSPKPVPPEILDRVLEAARLAPSAANYQPWRFIAVRDPALRKALFTHERQAWIADAPVVLVACGIPAKAWIRPSDKKNFVDIDVSIAMTHVLLAAAEEGLGSCWIGYVDPEHVAKVLDLPEGVLPVAATPLGFPAESARERNRKPAAEVITVIG